MTSLPSVALRGSAVVFADAPNPHLVKWKPSVRYADPLSWALVMAVGEATGSLGEDFTRAADRCSLIQVGAVGPRETWAQVASDAARGFASPLRFPAATPSAPTGLSCIVHGLRGPTLALTMPVATGAEVALAMSMAWLQRGVVDWALIGSVLSVEGRPPGAGCVVLSRGTGPGVGVEVVARSLQFRAE
ncbi:coronafacic acid synthetase [Corallococcus sp. CA047B]|uniref:coronafacic acid synthetase n=1 Tax=Corallococcus sp. CA047B TaxID=2316729 RepID=UPI000EA383DF|nr:coronafacic acid synthetase [Corallococcus sp. CA047B]RKH15282.1 coronafacic acid synthetase [Corallococcus sp. CA047B]